MPAALTSCVAPGRSQGRRPARSERITLGVIGFEQRWEYAAIGNVPNLAARLCGSAHAGEIILDGQTEQDIVGVAETEFIGALTLRGFQQPVPAFRLKSIRS